MGKYKTWLDDQELAQTAQARQTRQTFAMPALVVAPCLSDQSSCVVQQTAWSRGTSAFRYDVCVTHGTVWQLDRFGTETGGGSIHGLSTLRENCVDIEGAVWDAYYAGV